jgi:GNAT superfamily N-acetyltransferase
MNEDHAPEFHRLECLTDPAVPNVLDIFQQAFPYYEQIRVSYFWRYLLAPHIEANAHYYFYSMQLGKEVIGFTFFEIGKEVTLLGKPGYIWYLAIREDMRGKQHGALFYEFIQKIVREQGCRALTFEIEIEEEIRGRIGEEAARNAARRRDWYQRQGAKALGGIHYQYKDEGGIWEVMVHPFDDISAQDALALVMETIDGEYELISILTLT